MNAETRLAGGARLTSADENAKRCVIVAAVLTFLISIPLFALHTGYGDDWAWIWVHHWQGAAGIRHFMWEVAHPGFGPALNLFFWLAGDAAGSVARATAILLHIVNGWLLWSIFGIRRELRCFAATVAVLYLMDPYLGDLRATLSHAATYDAFIFFYLLSIRLSIKPGAAGIIVALACQLIGLSIETLAALEAIRWWTFYETGNRKWSLVARAAPFIVIVLALFLSRLTWLVPFGVYANHNSMKHFDINAYLRHAGADITFFFTALEPARFVLSLLARDNVVIGGVLALGTALIAVARYGADSILETRCSLRLAGLGFMLLCLGILPYAVVERDPSWTGFYSRFEVAAQFGTFIFAGLLVDSLRARTLRSIAFGCAVFVFAGMQLQFGKWALYDQAVFDDFERQAAIEFAHHDPELLLVRFEPESDQVFYLDRCLANYDLNVLPDIIGARHGSFAYDAGCDAAIDTANGKCGVTGFDEAPCPPVTEATFKIDPDNDDFRRFRLWSLIDGSLNGRTDHFGTLSVTAKKHPANNDAQTNGALGN